MSSIAFVGSGPGLGLAIAWALGAHGFDVTPVFGRPSRLDSLDGKLTSGGVTPAWFRVGSMDRLALP